MAVHSSKHQPLLLRLLLLVVAILCAGHAATQHSQIKCKTSCGSVIIPFPFGTTESCSLDSSFLIHCYNATPYLPQTNLIATRYLPQTNLTVLNISLNGELRVSFPVASKCYHNGTIINRTDWGFSLGDFSVSQKRNKLTAVGCDTIGGAAGWESDDKFYPYTTGCVSFCSNETVGSGSASCPTAGCCEASIPSQGQGRLSDFYYTTMSIRNHTYVSDFNPCGYTFLVEDGVYHFEPRDLEKLEKTAFPVVLDWAVGNRTCKEALKNASSYACKSPNSKCHNSTKGLGYVCNCSDGFRGNPYIENGCEGINYFRFFFFI